jgi:hypothetical protein
VVLLLLQCFYLRFVPPRHCKTQFIIVPARKC